eukprot:CAMPEP_0113505178 /NCGR_PEP_ID=MMETSP0014_2-20120614/35164_1 /TAXON_ID=2857 /ORGANISM="Nitzschia sp." /LENGTH=160 /DNA_ID=CAMNT_0000400445 /DNA_START=38 /DNA_END=520 /DNA_ORIENTATION=- /assembly_acc=CAM_ASM_000159
MAMTAMTGSCLVVMAAEQQQDNKNSNKEWYHHNGYSSNHNTNDNIGNDGNVHYDYFGDTTREQVLETRRRRKRQLLKMVDTSRQKLADHSAGQITLSSKEKQQLEDQMDIFQRKLNVWKDELEDWEIERLVDRERNRAEIRKQRSETTRRLYQSHQNDEM